VFTSHCNGPYLGHRAPSVADVRAVVLRHVLAGLGDNDELHLDATLQGFTAAWIPGDHGVTMLLGGATVDGHQREPGLTVFIEARSVQRLLKIGFKQNDLEVAIAEMNRTGVKFGEDKADFIWPSDVPPPGSMGGFYFPTKDPDDDPGLYRGYAHCLVLAKSDPLNPVWGAGSHRRAGWKAKWQYLSSIDIDGRVRTYESVESSERPSEERRFVFDFYVPQRVRVFLTADEVEDLLIVLRHRPEWLP